MFIILYHSDLQKWKENHMHAVPIFNSNPITLPRHFSFLNLAQEGFTDFGNYGYILPLISFDKCI